MPGKKRGGEAPEMMAEAPEMMAHYWRRLSPICTSPAERSVRKIFIKSVILASIILKTTVGNYLPSLRPIAISISRVRRAEKTCIHLANPQSFDRFSSCRFCISNLG